MRAIIALNSDGDPRMSYGVSEKCHLVHTVVIWLGGTPRRETVRLPDGRPSENWS